jgi:tetratricopeptide (TPR) repeat protein
MGILNIFKKKEAKRWNNEGNKLFKDGNYQSALKCYEQALEKDHMYETALNNMGLTLMNLNKNREALEYYDYVLKINPNVKTLNYKGKALYNLEMYENALKCFKKAIEFDPENKDALAGMYMALQKLGKHEEAKELAFKGLK